MFAMQICPFLKGNNKPLSRDYSEDSYHDSLLPSSGWSEALRLPQWWNVCHQH